MNNFGAGDNVFRARDEHFSAGDNALKMHFQASATHTLTASYQQLPNITYFEVMHL